MAQQLSPELNQRIIELLTPFMTTQERHAYIDPWCIGYANLYSQINWSGANRTFTTHIITLFLRYGSVESGKTALQYLLESVRKSMGLEDQTEIDTILHILGETISPNNGSDSWNTPVPKSSLSQSSPVQSHYGHMIPEFIKLNNRVVIFIATLLILIGLISVTYLDIFSTGTVSQSTTPITKTPAISPSILIVTSTPIPTLTPVIITPGEVPKNISASVQSYCTSLIGYNTHEEIKSILASGLGFDGPLNELEFYNGDIFGEVCAIER